MGLQKTYIGNNGNGSLDRYSSLDNGSWSIKDARGERVNKEKLKDGHETIEELDELDREKILSIFDQTSSLIVKNYPNTKEWYATLRNKIANEILIELSPEEMMKRKINRLEKKVQDLTEQEEDLKSRNEKLTKMLRRALNFIDGVGENMLGKRVFKKSLKEFGSARKEYGED